jgi:hypothetical protein
VPLALATATHAPVAALHEPTLQASLSALQSTLVPSLHCKVCRSHVSTPLQALPSSQSALVLQGHAVESTVQPPSFSEQLSTVQAMLSLQTVALPPHLPPVHVSGPVQVRPSLQVVPSALTGLLHSPVFTSHVPAEWQLSAAVQVT